MLSEKQEKTCSQDFQRREGLEQRLLSEKSADKAYWGTDDYIN